MTETTETGRKDSGSLPVCEAQAVPLLGSDLLGSAALAAEEERNGPVHSHDMLVPASITTNRDVDDEDQAQSALSDSSIKDSHRHTDHASDAQSHTKVLSAQSSLLQDMELALFGEVDQTINSMARGGSDASLLLPAVVPDVTLFTPLSPKGNHSSFTELKSILDMHLSSSTLVTHATDDDAISVAASIHTHTEVAAVADSNDHNSHSMPMLNRDQSPLPTIPVESHDDVVSTVVPEKEGFLHQDQADTGLHHILDGITAREPPAELSTMRLSAPGCESLGEINEALESDSFDEESLVLVPPVDPTIPVDVGLQAGCTGVIPTADIATSEYCAHDSDNDNLYDELGSSHHGEPMSKYCEEEEYEAVHANAADQNTTHASQEPTPLLVEVIDSIFTPGLSSRVQVVMHIIFAAMTLNFGILLYLSEFNPHVIFLFCISICLWGSTTWFLLTIPDDESAPKTAEVVTSDCVSNTDSPDHALPIESKKDI
ncbi:hypothetical protein BASA83_000799 [Batrachochytrium salamandrivorans]|nr:hypothetical protein BASA83_000799 [Batrachochytrium salamandrivorans]